MTEYRAIAAYAKLLLSKAAELCDAVDADLADAGYMSKLAAYRDGERDDVAQGRTLALWESQSNVGRDNPDEFQLVDDARKELRLAQYGVVCVADHQLSAVLEAVQSAYLALRTKPIEALQNGDLQTLPSYPEFGDLIDSIATLEHWVDKVRVPRRPRPPTPSEAARRLVNLLGVRATEWRWKTHNEQIDRIKRDESLLFRWSEALTSERKREWSKTKNHVEHLSKIHWYDCRDLKAIEGLTLKLFPLLAENIPPIVAFLELVDARDQAMAYRKLLGLVQAEVNKLEVADPANAGKPASTANGAIKTIEAARPQAARPNKPLSLELVGRVRDGVYGIHSAAHLAYQRTATDDAARWVEEHRKEDRAFSLPTGAELDSLEGWLTFTLQRSFDGWGAKLLLALNALRRLTPGLQGRRDTPAEVSKQIPEHLKTLEAAVEVLGLLSQRYKPDEVASTGEEILPSGPSNSEPLLGLQQAVFEQLKSTATPRIDAEVVRAIQLFANVNEEWREIPGLNQDDDNDGCAMGRLAACGLLEMLYDVDVSSEPDNWRGMMKIRTLGEYSLSETGQAVLRQLPMSWFDDAKRLKHGFRYQFSKAGRYRIAHNGRLLNEQTFSIQEVLNSLRTKKPLRHFERFIAYPVLPDFPTQFTDTAAEELEPPKAEPLATGEGTASKATKPVRRKRGPKRRYPPKEDQKLWDAWQTGSYQTHYDLAVEKGMKFVEVKRALDRVRKARNKSPRKAGQGE